MSKILTAIIFLFVLAGCSSKPSSGDIEDQVIKNLLRDGLGEIIAIENFEKINGYEKDSRTYTAEIEYDVVFIEGLEGIAKMASNEAQGSPLDAMQAGLVIVMLRMKFGNFDAGYRFRKTENVTFVDSENGWVLVGDLSALE